MRAPFELIATWLPITHTVARRFAAASEQRARSHTPRVAAGLMGSEIYLLLATPGMSSICCAPRPPGVTASSVSLIKIGALSMN